MSNTSERTLSGWLAFLGSQKETNADSSLEQTGSLATLNRRQSKSDRLRLIIAIVFSIGLHLLLFFGFDSKPAKDTAVKVPVTITAELFKIPVEEPEPAAEEAAETTPALTANEFPPPSLPELIAVPVDTDFVVAPLPPVPTGVGPAPTQFVIPQNLGRSTVAATQKIFTLSELDRVPQLVRSEKPNYPIELLSARISGLVVVRFIVDAQGEIQNMKIMSTPHPFLGVAVTRSLSRWRFKPGMKGGRAVSTTMELPVEFTPEEQL